VSVDLIEDVKRKHYCMVHHLSGEKMCATCRSYWPCAVAKFLEAHGDGKCVPLVDAESRLPTRAQSEAWLRELCKREGLYEGAYERLVEDEVIYGADDIDTSGEFWFHWHNVTGRSERPEFGFRCSC
jgi:hypothetical protein